uniref:Uncharacterized protein n=1 Tax=Fusarium oxysporum (strain Fo5176) TaxID=660025 RepID=A0A0D2XG29_FUSOF
MRIQATAETNSHNARNWVPLLDEPAFKPRNIHIICVGAGFSGLMLAYEAKYNESLQGFIDLTIYDKNHDVGGTWLVNRYPGVARTFTLFHLSQTLIGPVSMLQGQKYGLISRERPTSMV